MARRAPNKTSRALTRSYDWTRKFLDALAQCGNVTEAARVAAVNKDTAYARRKDDAAFARQWYDALDTFADKLEAHVDSLIFHGLRRKKFDKGVPIIDPSTKKQYVEVEYPIPLIITRLKSVRPEKYRENVKPEPDDAKNDRTIRVRRIPAAKPNANADPA